MSNNINTSKVRGYRFNSLARFELSRSLPERTYLLLTKSSLSRKSFACVFSEFRPGELVGGGVGSDVKVFTIHEDLGI